MKEGDHRRFLRRPCRKAVTEDEGLLVVTLADVTALLAIVGFTVWVGLKIVALYC